MDKRCEIQFAELMLSLRVLSSNRLTTMTLFVSRVVSVITLLAWCAQAQDRARLDAVVQDFASRKQFMGSVLVARGSEVLLSKGYGFANMEWEIPNTPAT